MAANLLNHYYDVNVVAGTFDINALTKCAVIQDGLPIVEDAYLQLIAVNKVVEAEVKLLDESKKELFDKFGEGEGEERFIPKEKMEEFNKEYLDLLNAEKEIDVVSLWSTDITPDTLASIETEEVYPVFLKLVDK